MVYKVYRRPSIDLDAAKKSWADRKPWKIVVGAIIPDYGEVAELHVSDVGGSTSIFFTNGKFLYVDGNDTIYCFQ